MKIDDHIFIYLDDGMNDGEKRIFEEKLAQSDELRKQLRYAEKMLGGVKALSEIETNDSYFINSTVKFREKLSNGQNRLKMFWAKAFAPAAAIVTATILLFSVININSEFSLEEVFTVNDTSLDTDFIEDYSGISYESEFFTYDAQSLETLKNTFLQSSNIPIEYESEVYEEMSEDYDEIIYSYSDEEVAALYSELAEENPLRGIQ